MIPTHMEKSSFRISGWKDTSTGIVNIFYGNEAPIDDGTHVKIFDQQVETTKTVTNLMAGAVDTAACPGV